MKAGTDFQQARDAAFDPHPAFGGLGNAAQNFKQRAFAGAVAPDDANDFSLPDFEANVPERPKIFCG